jgi:hypothetical protein
MSTPRMEKGTRTKATTWVLDTQTKGTGATMVPLERVLARPGAPAPGFSLPELRPIEPEQPRMREPHEFKIVDVMSRQVLAAGVDARAAVDALKGVRSIVDVTVYVWEPDSERWRMLTLAETRALWDYRATESDGRPTGPQS